MAAKAARIVRRVPGVRQSGVRQSAVAIQFRCANFDETAGVKLKTPLPPYARGQTAVLFAFALVAVVGALALTTDVTASYWNWEQVQKAADAGALAGASQYIPNIPSPP